MNNNDIKATIDLSVHGAEADKGTSSGLFAESHRLEEEIMKQLDLLHFEG